MVILNIPSRIIGLSWCFSLFFFFFFFAFLGAAPEAYESSQAKGWTGTTATAMQNLRCICNLYHSSLQHWTTDPLSEARDQAQILRDTSRIHFCFATIGILSQCFPKCGSHYQHHLGTQILPRPKKLEILGIGVGSMWFNTPSFSPHNFECFQVLQPSYYPSSLWKS